jgi:hypothetical protein
MVESWPWRLPATWNIAGMRTLGTIPLPDTVSSRLYGNDAVSPSLGERKLDLPRLGALW